MNLPIDGVLGVIPARGGSKSIKHKNLAMIGGRPLIEYTIRQAFEASRLDEVIVSTDSEEIAKVALALGAEAPFIRPAHLATDSATSFDVMLHALELMEQRLGRIFGAVVMLQPTTPFRPNGLIDEAVGRLAMSDLDSIVSVVEVGANHPHRMYVIDESKLLSPIIQGINDPMIARQLLPKTYIRSGDIYVTRRDCLIKQRSLLGQRSGGLVIPDDASLNIDSLRDLEFARYLHAKQLLDLH